MKAMLEHLYEELGVTAMLASQMGEEDAHKLIGLISTAVDDPSDYGNIFGLLSFVRENEYLSRQLEVNDTWTQLRALSGKMPATVKLVEWALTGDITPAREVNPLTGEEQLGWPPVALEMAEEVGEEQARLAGILGDLVAAYN